MMVILLLDLFLGLYITSVQLLEGQSSKLKFSNVMHYCHTVFTALDDECIFLHHVYVFCCLFI